MPKLVRHEGIFVPRRYDVNRFEEDRDGSAVPIRLHSEQDVIWCMLGLQSKGVALHGNLERVSKVQNTVQLDGGARAGFRREGLAQ